MQQVDGDAQRGEAAMLRRRLARLERHLSEARDAESRRQQESQQQLQQLRQQMSAEQDGLSTQVGSSPTQIMMKSNSTSLSISLNFFLLLMPRFS